MLVEAISDISPEQIESLVANEVAENRKLEYKERLPENSERAKKEFLADVCSFANSSGGDILYGISDRRSPEGRPTGTPDSIVGLTNDNLAGECDRLEKLVRDGISPRIPGIQTKILQVKEASVVLLRIRNSWIKPHMVTLAGTSRFFSRNSTGKFQLDVTEIGHAFAEQRSIGERIRIWRANRAAKAMEDDAPAQLVGPGKLLVHLIPASSMVGQLDASGWLMPERLKYQIRTSSLSAISFRYNADGFLVYSRLDHGGYQSYVQLFQNGCIEFGDGYILNAVFRSNGQKRIPGKTFERKMIEIYNHGLDILGALNTDSPIYVCCSLLSVRGMYMSRDEADLGIGEQHVIDRETVFTSPILIDDADRQGALLATVNSIWQANGYEQTPHLFGSKWNPY